MICSGDRDQNHPQEKEKQEGKVVICGDFMNIGRTKRSENQGGEGEVHPIKCRVSNNSWKRQKSFLQ